MNDTRNTHAPKFTKVLDGRKHPVRGLWLRNGRYYAQLRFEDGTTGQTKTRRVPLLDNDKLPVQTTAQAVAELARLKTNRADNDLPVLTRTPKFADFVKVYLDFVQAGAGMKKKATIDNERYALNGWIKEIGGVHLDKLREAHLNAYVAKRLKAGTHPRTVNLDVVALRNVLRHARAEKWIRTLPEFQWLKSKTAKRELFTPSDLEALCAAALATKQAGEGKPAEPVTKNGPQLVDYLRFLAFSGAREQEALAVRWQDVDFDREQITIGATGDTKNSTGRVVDFNPMLKDHLEDLQEHRAPDCQWLFPSPQRGDKDIHARSFRESLKLARAHAAQEKPALAGKAFHDMRHFFISYAVMAGIDFMTIASWVGHRDGGILIGKVYGHLADSHKKAQAAKLNFGPVIVAKESAA